MKLAADVFAIPFDVEINDEVFDDVTFFGCEDTESVVRKDEASLGLTDLELVIPESCLTEDKLDEVEDFIVIP